MAPRRDRRSTQPTRTVTSAESTASANPVTHTMAFRAKLDARAATVEYSPMEAVDGTFHRCVRDRATDADRNYIQAVAAAVDCGYYDSPRAGTTIAFGTVCTPDRTLSCDWVCNDLQRLP
ncbi:MAG: hypothetical protein ABEH58_08930 [Haloplanus sp.]